MEMASCDVMNDILSRVLWYSDTFLRVVNYQWLHFQHKFSKITPTKGCYTTNHVYSQIEEPESASEAVVLWKETHRDR